MKPKIGNKMKRILLILSLTLFSQISLATVTATADRTHVIIGETFNLTLSIDENTSEQPDFSELSQSFRVLGTNQSSSTKIVNGSYSVEKKWQVSLMPLGIGKTTIPAIKLGNQSSAPIQITTSRSDPNAKANGDIFIEITTDKQTAFVKEQIIMTIKLFYSISLSEGNLSEPIAKSTIVTQLDKGSNYRTNRDGKTYEVIERHYAIFAEKSGTLDVNPIIFNGRDNSSRRNFSMFSTGKPVRAVSKPQTFEIKPIPQASIGKDWLPATKVQVSQQWSKQPFKVGEPITRTITLYIEGLSETQIPDIELGDIDDIRVYPEQPQTQTEKTAQMVKSYKQVKLALIPTHEGSIRIPEYQLEWYNTKTNKVELAKLPPMTIKVEAGEFALNKPGVGNIFGTPETKPTATVAELNQKPEVQEQVKIVEKDNLLWKIVAAVFALLWIITMVLYLRKPALKKQTKSQNKHGKVTAISKKQIIAAIYKQDNSQLEKDLLSWWNQQHSNKQVTNISQIKPWIKPEMQQLIDELETQIYNSGDSQEINQQQWLKQIKSNGLDVVNNKNNAKITELPELY